jgi:hypothetical protein
MEFSKSIFSYCDYIVVLDFEVHGHHMDITAVFKGIIRYCRVLDALNYYKFSQVANLTPSNPTR